MSAAVSHPVIKMRGADITALRDPALTVLANVDWSVSAGEFWVVAGVPRSGKSDLLLHAAGLMMPARGKCSVFGCDTESFGEAQIAERRRVGFVFAGGKLFNQLTVAENIALPLSYQNDSMTETEVAGKVEALLELLELTPLATTTPPNLATHWRQRVALARAMALRPELLLLDQPLAGLGPWHRQWLLQFLDQLWRGHEFFGGRPMTIVATTDDLRFWAHPHRKFVVLDEMKFAVLGGWSDVKNTGHRAVKELLAEPLEAKI
jgi:phospholipid/cholesterol/gamma-HCH transport system ATP-binding protein